VAAKAGKEMWSIDSMRRIRIPPYLYIPINPLSRFFCTTWQPGNF
jgi:hypothetical protein